MTPRYDLHCHSDQSDGILSPEALVSRAKAQGVTVLALTDHDTTAGLARASAQAEREGIRLIPGIECSAQWQGRGLHIVGLNVDVAAPALSRVEASLGEARLARAQAIGRKLEAMGVANAFEGARAYSPDGVIGRPHFAAHLVAAGHCRDNAQAFKKYLGAGKPGDIKQHWPEIGPTVAAITAAGGIAVLAHPLKYKMTHTKLCAMVRDFVEAGGRAIEVISGAQDGNGTASLARLAQRFGLQASSGSDFHAPGMPWQELGSQPELPPELVPVWRSW